jgi:hypothetical protein
MKTVISTTIALSFFSVVALSQAELDKPLQLTGSGSDAKIEGIKSVTDAEDAVSAEVVQKNVLSYAEATNVGNAYAVNLAPAITALAGGQLVHFRATAANTGLATLNVNGLGAIDIRKNVDVPLDADDIKAGQLVSVMYDSANNRFQMLSQLGQAASAGASSSWGTTGTFTTVAPVTRSSGTNPCMTNGGVQSSSGKYFIVGDLVYLEITVVIQNNYSSCNCSNGVEYVDVTLPSIIQAANTSNNWGKMVTRGGSTTYNPGCVASLINLNFLSTSTLRIQPVSGQCTINSSTNLRSNLAFWNTCASGGTQELIFNIVYQKAP